MSTERELKEKAASRDYGTRMAAARDPSLPPYLVERLAADGSQWVRRGIARRPDLPLDLVERLAADADWVVRRAIAKRALTRIEGSEDDKQERKQG